MLFWQSPINARVRSPGVRDDVRFPLGLGLTDTRVNGGGTKADSTYQVAASPTKYSSTAPQIITTAGGQLVAPTASPTYTIASPAGTPAPNAAFGMSREAGTVAPDPLTAEYLTRYFGTPSAPVSAAAGVSDGDLWRNPWLWLAVGAGIFLVGKRRRG